MQSARQGSAPDMLGPSHAPRPLMLAASTYTAPKSSASIEGTGTSGTVRSGIVGRRRRCSNRHIGRPGNRGPSRLGLVWPHMGPRKGPEHEQDGQPDDHDRKDNRVRDISSHSRPRFRSNAAAGPPFLLEDFIHHGRLTLEGSDGAELG